MKKLLIEWGVPVAGGLAGSLALSAWASVGVSPLLAAFLSAFMYLGIFWIVQFARAVGLGYIRFGR